MKITLSITGAAVTTSGRMIAGTVFRYGETGLTSAGPLRVAPGALQFPDDVTTVPLTLEHDASIVRGSLQLVDDSPERLYIAARVVDGELGDQAIAEAADRTRAGLSFALEDATVSGGVITSGRVVGMGQVAEPAFNSARVDQIAAAKTPANSGVDQKGALMTEEQRRRLEELRAQNTRTPEEETEYQTLVTLAVDDAVAQAPAPQEPAPAAPAAQPVSAAAVPVAQPGVPTAAPRPATRTAPVSALDDFVNQIVAAWSANKMHGNGSITAAINRVITAALADITQTGVGPTVERKQWIGELWSGVEYQPQFIPLLGADGMDNFSGIGWHWTTKPVAQDYAGDKAAITTPTIAVAADNWSAARLVVGNDIDRKFFDFPGEDNAAFIRSYLKACAEALVKMLDQKALAYIIGAGNSTAIAGAAGLGVLKAAATGKIALTNNWMGQADYVLVNDQDYLGLLDTTASNVPAFLELIGVAPDKMIPSSSVTAKSLYVGVRNAGTLRTPKGQPFTVEAQNVANGGIDLVSFAYWATEKHTALGIQKVSWT
jgi:hypothetical protein